MITTETTDKLMQTSTQMIFSAAIASFVAYLGALAVPIIVMIIMMVIDYVTGMGAAWMRGELSSRVGAKGIAKKVGYMGLIVVAMGMDYLVSSGFAAVNITPVCDMWFAMLVAVWLIINEMISILENLNEMGVPLPVFLIRILKRVKTTVDINTGNEVDKNEKGN